MDLCYELVRNKNQSSRFDVEAGGKILPPVAAHVRDHSPARGDIKKSGHRPL